MIEQTIAHVKCVSWDKIYSFDATGIEIVLNDYVVVNTQLGLTLGEAVLIEKTPQRPTTVMMEKIIRKATELDLAKFAQMCGIQKKEAQNYCKKIIRDFNLEMKLIDVYFSIDDQRITFAFVANGRVDFRELVKNLSAYFKKSIRLQQIGVRDEANFLSDTGACGQQTCCTRFLKELGNVNVSFAETQQVSHRGSDRLSGVCGRLACCLRYEQDIYEKAIKNFPNIGSTVNLKTGKKGIVKSLRPLKNQLCIEIIDDEKSIIEINLNDIIK